MPCVGSTSLTICWSCCFAWTNALLFSLFLSIAIALSNSGWTAFILFNAAVTCDTWGLSFVKILFASFLAESIWVWIRDLASLYFLILAGVLPLVSIFWVNWLYAFWSSSLSALKPVFALFNASKARSTFVLALEICCVVASPLSITCCAFDISCWAACCFEL